jgi:hypothetical protein
MKCKVSGGLRMKIDYKEYKRKQYIKELKIRQRYIFGIYKCEKCKSHFKKEKGWLYNLKEFFWADAITTTYFICKDCAKIKEDVYKIIKDKE